MSSPPPRKRRRKSTYLYSLGSNGNYQLGLRHNDDISTPERCSFDIFGENEDFTTRVPLELGESIKKIVAGGNHTLLLTTAGRVWTAGGNDEGQRALESQPKLVAGGWGRLSWPSESTHGLADTPPRQRERSITDIAATWTASFFVVDETEIYSVGSCAKGSLGLGLHTTSTSVPRKCFDLRVAEPDGGSTIKEISGCMNHIVVVSTSGNVYGWGASRKGQLGGILVNEKSVWTPTRIQLDSARESWTPRHVVTGRDFTVIVSEAAEVCTWITLGDSTKLGIETQTVVRDTPEPQKVQSKEDVEGAKKLSEYQSLGCKSEGDKAKRSHQVHAGWTSITTLSSMGSIQVLPLSHHISPGSFSSSLPNIASIAAGSEHIVASTAEDNVITWGWGEHGNCGKETDQKGYVKDSFNTIFVPDAEKEQKVLGIAAGCATSFFWVGEEEEEARDVGEDP